MNSPSGIQPPLAWIFGLILAFSTGCQSVTPTLAPADWITSITQPSNNREWSPDQQAVPFARVSGRHYSIQNIRNCNYLTPEDYIVNYYDREILLDQIQSVDFIMVPFNETFKLAHTMLSFGLDDGSYLAVSVEIRKEKGEAFNPLKGLGRQFELMYVLSDERDVIRLRTEHRDSDVYVYPTVATPAQAQSLFADVVQRINKLAVEPEFYHSINNNCTTNLVGHVNEISTNRIPYSWKILVPGFSAEYAYELGLLDNRIPFEDLSEIARVNELAESYTETGDFSSHIRSRRHRLDRYLELQNQREPVLNGPGLEFLQSNAMGRQRRNAGLDSSLRTLRTRFQKPAASTTLR